MMIIMCIVMAVPAALIGYHVYDTIMILSEFNAETPMELFQRCYNEAKKRNE